MRWVNLSRENEREFLRVNNDPSESLHDDAKLSLMTMHRVCRSVHIERREIVPAISISLGPQHPGKSDGQVVGGCTSVCLLCVYVCMYAYSSTCTCLRTMVKIAHWRMEGTG